MRDAVVHHENYRRDGGKAKPVIGAHALRLADPRASYVSKKSGRKMICLSDDIDLRRFFIEWFKDQRDTARQNFLDFRDHKLPLSPPPGEQSERSVLQPKYTPSTDGCRSEG